MAMVFKKRKETFSNLRKTERFFCYGIADEGKLHAGLITAIFSVSVECPKVITACFASLSHIPVGMEIVQVVFFLHC